jgi:hypothetical protein
MNPKRIPTWRGRLCRVLLDAAAVALAAPTAEALGSCQHYASHGNDFVRLHDVANSYATNGPEFAAASIYQNLHSEVGGKWMCAFVLGGSAWHDGATGTAGAKLFIDDEYVLPPSSRPAFTLRDKFGYTQSAGAAAFAVGARTYDLRVTAAYDLDVELAGHAFSLFDTRVSGQVRAEARLSVAMWLPNDVMIEGGVAGVGNYSGRLVTASLPTHFDSLLTCDLSANNDGRGSWSRLQQEPWELKIRLLRTVRLGRFTYTEVLPIVDEKIAKVDKYILDKRVIPLPTFPIVRR